MIRVGLFLLFSAIWLAPPAPAQGFLGPGFSGPGFSGPAGACPEQGEAACMMEAIWQAASLLPPDKLERLRAEFAGPAEALLTDAKASAVWQARTHGAVRPPQPEGPDFARAQAEAAIAAHGWEGFFQRARHGQEPLNIGRPEIMAAAIDLAPDVRERERLIDLMFTLGGRPKTGLVSAAPGDAFERATFGHVLAERMMRDCRDFEFSLARQMTSAPHSIRYALWQARINGDAGALADEVRRGDGTNDTRHVRQALEGYGAILRLGYCPQ